MGFFSEEGCIKREGVRRENPPPLLLPPNFPKSARTTLSAALPRVPRCGIWDRLCFSTPSICNPRLWSAGEKQHWPSPVCFQSDNVLDCEKKNKNNNNYSPSPAPLCLFPNSVIGSSVKEAGSPSVFAPSIFMQPWNAVRCVMFCKIKKKMFLKMARFLQNSNSRSWRHVCTKLPAVSCAWQAELRWERVCVRDYCRCSSQRCI